MAIQLRAVFYRAPGCSCEKVQYIYIYIHFQDLFVSLVMFKYDLKILKLLTHCEKSVLLA